MRDKYNGDCGPPAPVEAGLRLLCAMRAFDGGVEEEALGAHLRAQWPDIELRRLLHHRDAAVVRAAAISLGLVGTFHDTAALCRALHHDDYFVTAAAERALCSIWMRASTPACNARLQRAVACLGASSFAEAEKLLDQILIEDPNFAEACNQRGLLHYLTERYASSMLAYHRTLALNPHHFGAAAGLGHDHFQLGEYGAALAAYRRALSLHPRMEGIRQAMRRTRDAADAPHGTDVASPVRLAETSPAEKTANLPKRC